MVATGAEKSKHRPGKSTKTLLLCGCADVTAAAQSGGRITAGSAAVFPATSGTATSDTCYVYMGTFCFIWNEIISYTQNKVSAHESPKQGVAGHRFPAALHRR